MFRVYAFSFSLDLVFVPQNLNLVSKPILHVCFTASEHPEGCIFVHYQCIISDYYVVLVRATSADEQPGKIKLTGCGGMPLPLARCKRLVS